MSAKQSDASTHTELGRGAEFDMIRELAARWQGVARGLGDDAALLDVGAGRRVLISSDASVENVHFRRGWLTAVEIGYRSATAALSDLAAMGAEPLGITVAMVLPEQWRDDFGHLADGIAAATRAADCPIIGGDLSRGDSLTLSFTVIGTAAHPVLRSGARAGQSVYLTGVLGGPLLALRALERGAEPPVEHRRRFAQPVARIPEGLWLAARGAAAMIDVSDGLTSDAEHLARASGAHLTIELDKLPSIAGADSQTAARSGEEYELLLTASALDSDAFRSAFHIPLTCIGTVSDDPENGSVSFTRGGLRVDLEKGYDHFSR